jgi:hypothetical protein
VLDYFGYVGSFLFDALLPRNGITDDQLLDSLSRFVDDMTARDLRRKEEPPMAVQRLSAAAFRTFHGRPQLSLYLPVDPLEVLGRQIGFGVFQNLDLYSLIRVGQVCRYPYCSASSPFFKFIFILLFIDLFITFFFEGRGES